MKKLLCAALLISGFAITSCGDSTNSTETTAVDSTKAVNIKEEEVSYNADNTQLKGYVTYNENSEGKRPGILIVHEWWGLGDYTRNRAKQLAELGYIAMAVDMYGEGVTGNDPAQAQSLATPFYQTPALSKIRLDAAIEKLKTFAVTDTANLAAIGYCFGGYVVLNAAKLGADLKGVVSFHGGLAGAQPDKNLLKSAILVAHGGSDQFVPEAEVNAFKKGMDSIGADYTFKVYENATHAFTNPDATATGQKFKMPIEYNAAADSASWSDMKMFLNKIFAIK